MADPPRSTEPKTRTDMRPERGLPPSTPRWVKVAGIIGIVLVLVFVILHLTGHSPGGHASHVSLTEHGVRHS
jgi:hypothetical protein